MAVVDYKCPNCGAILKFNPKTQKWDCKYCDSKLELKDLVVNDIKYKNKVQLLKNVDIYSCENCGAELICDNNTAATFCVYCKSTAIIKNRLVDEHQPDKIIPFSKTKEEAIEAFKKLCDKNFLIPKEFKKGKNIEEIRGVYIPFWLFDIKYSGEVIFNAKHVETLEESKYKVIKIDHYKVEREGNVYFEGIPVDGSMNFNDDLMNSLEPFDYSGLKKFNYGYLSGFYAEKYGLSDLDIYNIALNRGKTSFINYLKDDINYYTDCDVAEENFNYELSQIQYVLLPVWLLNIKYKEKIRTFAMNAQTGMIVGDLPVDIKKVLILGTIIFIILFITIVIVFYSLGWCLR